MMYSGDEDFGDDVTSGIDHQDEPYEGELDQADFEHELEDAESDDLGIGYTEDWQLNESDRPIAGNPNPDSGPVDATAP